MEDIMAGLKINRDHFCFLLGLQRHHRKTWWGFSAYGDKSIVHVNAEVSFPIILITFIPIWRLNCGLVVQHICVNKMLPLYLTSCFKHTWKLTIDKHWPFVIPPQGSIRQLHTLDPLHLPQRGCQQDCQWYTSYMLFLLCDPCDPCPLMHKTVAQKRFRWVDLCIRTNIQD